MTTAATTPDTIVLIHGLWMTPRCWEKWIPYYEAKGFNVIAPGYPGFEVEVEALRADPTPIESLTVDQVAHHYESIIRGLDKPPIIIGHSFGGALVQILADRSCGAAIVAISTNPVRGIPELPLSTIKSVWPVLSNLANRHRAVPFTFEQFHEAFANTLSDEEARAVYERYHIPAPGGIVFSGATANFNPHAPNTVDFSKENRAPLLFIGASEDVIMPASISRSCARHYNTGISAYKEFEGRSHFICGEKGWEEVADFALAWALNPTEDVNNVQPLTASA
jgi:pimeloyl-ACP methyl ester carboxylesterase